MDEEFYRLAKLPPYVFSEVNKLKAEQRSKGNDIIDFGMGNPDFQPPKHVVQKLCETLDDPKFHRYSVSRGIKGLRKAHAAYYAERFNVTIDPETQIVCSLGSKEGFVSLAQAITAPGDVVLVPNPNYPIHNLSFIIAGGNPVSLEHSGNSEMITEIKSKIENASRKPLALVLNYPCNPTTETVDLGFYEQVVDICRHHGVYILSDLAYCEIYFNDIPPPSILQVKGAEEIAVEFTTVSKTYSMPGWRVGFVCGNKRLIKALATMKSYLDYGGFLPIQVAAAAALSDSQDYITEIRNLYRQRRDSLVSGLNMAGWECESPDATLFVWTKIPEQYRDIGSVEFSKLLTLLANTAVSPGAGFGKNGEGYVRFALVENNQRIRQSVKSIKNFLQNDPKEMQQKAKSLCKAT